jgi:hypothetical protein
MEQVICGLEKGLPRRCLCGKFTVATPHTAAVATDDLVLRPKPGAAEGSPAPDAASELAHKIAE